MYGGNTCQSSNQNELFEGVLKINICGHYGPQKGLQKIGNLKNVRSGSFYLQMPLFERICL